MAPAVLNYFMAGRDLVTWELAALGPDGSAPFRLVFSHAGGTITEHFDTVRAALFRQAQIEALLVAARGIRAFETFPLPPAEDSTPVETTPAVEETSRDAPTILVVDDDRAVTETFATALHREGFNVRTAANAETGLREVAAHRTDAIIVDLRMPLINGLGFLYRLRNSDEHRRTPVAIVTGSVVDDSTAAELSELGAELRFKPLWLEDVVQLAHHLLDRPA
jgi:CheY-like chemotaxis protein